MDRKGGHVDREVNTLGNDTIGEAADDGVICGNSGKLRE